MKLSFTFISSIARVCLCGCLLVMLPAHAKRLALVMGNDNYTSVTKLQKAGNDATAMARELKAAGFTVQLHKDLNYRGMVKAVETFTNSITGGDEVVVFYAGHGVQIKTGSYLLPTDIEASSESEVEKTAYELNALTDKISEAKPAFSLVMVDACRDNPLKAKGRTVGNTRGLSAIEPPKGQMVVYSASRGQQALDRLSDKDTNPNGVFTREFIARMKKPGVKIEDLMREVQDSVETLAKTVSHEQRPAIYNEARGNFYFFGPTTVQMVATPKPESVAPSSRPGQVDVLSLADLEREEAIRKEWAAWQSRMKADFDKTVAFTGSADLMVKAWERFLVAWSQDNPNSQDDESLRTQALSKRDAARQVSSQVQISTQQLSSSGSSSNVIKIGHVAPTSGAIAHLGKDNENGARLAIEELNAKGVKIGGKAVKFELIAEDDAADPKQAVAAAQRLVNAKVNGVIGHLTSGASIPASKIYSDAGIPQISPSSVNPKFTRSGYKTTFRIVADDVHLGGTLGRYAVNNVKGKSIAVIDDRTAYGQGVAEEFEKAVKAAGGNLVGHEFTTSRASDFMSILTTLKARNPDVVFFGGMDLVAGPMIRQMNLLGINAKFMGGDGICSSELAKLAGDAMADGQVICAEAGGVQSHQVKGMQDFVARFKTRFNADVQVYAPYVYDALNVMVDSMMRANSSDPAIYLPELARTQGFKGVTGDISFDYKGDIKNAALTLYTYRNGRRNQIAIIR